MRITIPRKRLMGNRECPNWEKSGSDCATARIPNPQGKRGSRLKSHRNRPVHPTAGRQPAGRLPIGRAIARQPTAGRQPADRLPVGRAIARQTRMPGGVGGVMVAIPSPRPDSSAFSVFKVDQAAIRSRAHLWPGQSISTCHQ